MSNVDFECVVVGAGVVGLAVAVALARAGRDVCVLEAEARAGEGVSSRNSGVIHAGLYYPPGSLKARLCVRGRDLLYRYAEARGVAHRRTGKLIVAVADDEVPALRALHARGVENGVALRWLEAADVAAMEPGLHCVAALDSPDSGIVDVAELVLGLVGDLQHAGGQLVCRTRVQRINAVDGLLEVLTDGGERVRSRVLVNAAGLGATTLAATFGHPEGTVPRLWLGAGHYYHSLRPVPFRRLIYPLPQPGGLGVHLGFDLGGRARFGPDLRYIERLDYGFDDSQRGLFAAAIRRWWPVLEDDDLTPDFVGVRPKLVGPGQHNPDFMISGEPTHGVRGLLHLFGIESPGLTSALAIGEHVEAMLR